MTSAPEIAVILTGPDRRILWVNDGFTRITGYSIAEVIGKKPSLLQGENTEPEIISRIRENLENQLPVRESITNYRKDGEEYCCTLVIYPIFDQEGKLRNFIAFEVDSDVTDEEGLPILQLQKRYGQSSLKGSRAVGIYSRLCELLEKEEAFRDPDLSLPGIAQILETNTNYLSQVVNQFASQNFQQFINGYRVEAFQSAVIRPENKGRSYFSIAEEYGFRTKSTFFRVFKQHTGKTPAAYMADRKK
ncbi:MAG: PAS domain-containing protein [Bacteroidetes bacterium]|nr:PAS domain-containing protein [Bacteroidota bacterium]